MSAEQISVKVRASDVLVKLRGNVRVDSASSLQQRLLETLGTKDLAVDWEQAEHVDASALQVLLACAKTLKQRTGALRVEKDNPHVRQYLELAGLSDYFPLRQLPPAAEANSNASA